MRTVAIIQARMGSTRLPGKVMKRLCGRTILEHVVTRVAACGKLDDVVVATSSLPADDIIVAKAHEYGAKSFRGSEEDVLSRYYYAAAEFAADAIVRVTSDCPLFDPDLLDAMLSVFIDGCDTTSDYLSNTITRTYPRGLDTEIFTKLALDKAFHEADKPYEREHVTPYMHQHPELFSLAEFRCDADRSMLRWTVDTVEDFYMVSEIYSALYSEGHIFRMKQILDLLDNRPELAAINAHVEQKKLEG